jgi:hypothetical protein
MFRFTIRDVLWLMVVVGMGVGWWVEHRQQVALRLKQTKIQGELIRSHQAEALRAREIEASIRMRQLLTPELNPQPPRPVVGVVGIVGLIKWTWKERHRGKRAIAMSAALRGKTGVAG